MSEVEEWSVRLARAAAPDEVDLAPDLAHAYIAGGRARRELFMPADTMHGAFGVGDVIVLMPFVFKAIHIAGPVLLSLLTSEMVSVCFSAVENAAAMVKSGKAITEIFQTAKAPTTPDPYASLRHVVQTMDRELQATGLGAEQRNHITLQVVRALLEEPKGATTFVKEVAAKR
jgi:hypothetical protein